MLLPAGQTNKQKIKHIALFLEVVYHTNSDKYKIY